MKKNVPVNLLISLLLIAAVIIGAVWGLSQAGRAGDQESVRVLEDSIRRAAVCCYVAEGRYPDTIEYLCDNYGIYVDAEVYAVYYEIFASNVMPDVDVVYLGGAA